MAAGNGPANRGPGCPQLSTTIAAAFVERWSSGGPSEASVRKTFSLSDQSPEPCQGEAASGIAGLCRIRHNVREAGAELERAAQPSRDGLGKSLSKYRATRSDGLAEASACSTDHIR